MPIPKARTLEAWSFSRLGTYEQCPRKLFFQAIERIKQPDRAVLERGRKIEDEALDFIFGRVAKLPESCARFPEEFAALKKIAKRLVVKQRLAFNRRWELVDYFAPDAWLRFEPDIMWEELLPKQKKHWQLRVVDLKSGKVYEDKVDQVELYNLCGFLLPESIITHNPQVAHGELYYLDQGVIRERLTERKNVEAEKARWEKRVAPMMSDTIFKPCPSYLCKWCFYRKGNKAEGGGQCQF